MKPKTLSISIWLLLLSVCVAGASEIPKYKNVSDALGLKHVYSGGWEHFVGGGVAVFDCNEDNMPDIFMAGGAGPDSLYVNLATPGQPLRLSKENISSGNRTIGAYPLDIDGDGRLDLFVLKAGHNLILRGLPDCQFEDATSKFGYLDSPMWSTAFSATWEKGNSFPTFAVGNYVDQDHTKAPFGTCEDNFLYRPNGLQYTNPQSLSPGYCALSILFSDWGRKGSVDLRVSNDRHYYVKGGAEQLWKMSEKPRLYTQEEGWQSYSIWGMGIASRDITGDGIPEVYLTSMGDQKLHHLTDMKRPHFGNAPYSAGITAHRPYTGDDGRPSTGWHAEFGDVNNDGLDDLFVAKGNVDQMPDAATHDPNNLLLGLGKSQFKEVGDQAGVASMHRGRGAALVDLNLDGKLDIVVINRRANAEILMNETQSNGAFLNLKLQQNSINTQLVGGWIEVRTDDGKWDREITVGGGHASGHAGFHHFGLGAASEAKVRVQWLDGGFSDWVTLKTSQNVVLTRSGNALNVEYIN